jgi:hypothetical protein
MHTVTRTHIVQMDMSNEQTALLLDAAWSAAVLLNELDPGHCTAGNRQRNTPAGAGISSCPPSEEDLLACITYAFINRSALRQSGIQLPEVRRWRPTRQALKSRKADGQRTPSPVDFWVSNDGSVVIAISCWRCLPPVFRSGCRAVHDSG